ncbi:MAG: hypothetical protein GX200_00830 [Firmicutes bacterium]|nr:hypothetical protein [Bacillota bacterium]
MEVRTFLMRAMLNEQEQVRDYQRFARTTDDAEISQAFFEFAETSGRTAARIKELLDKIESQ